MIGSEKILKLNNKLKKKSFMETKKKIKSKNNKSQIISMKTMPNNKNSTTITRKKLKRKKFESSKNFDNDDIISKESDTLPISYKSNVGKKRMSVRMSVKNGLSFMKKKKK